MGPIALPGLRARYVKRPSLAALYITSKNAKPPTIKLKLRWRWRVSSSATASAPPTCEDDVCIAAHDRLLHANRQRVLAIAAWAIVSRSRGSPYLLGSAHAE